MKSATATGFLKSKSNYRQLPPGLVRYIIPVSIVGPVLAFALAALARPSMSSELWLSAIVLGLLALIAERYPLHLTYKTNVNMATAVYVAMFLVLPLGVAPVVTLIGVGIAQALRMRANPEMGIEEPLFNTGQTTLYVSLSALAVGLTNRSPLGELWFGHINLGASLVASIVLHLTNTALVSAAAGLHLGTGVVRVWRTNLTLEVGPHLAMTLMGICAAVLGRETPLLIPTLVVPALLVNHAVGQSHRLRENVYEALASLVEIVELRDPYTAGHSRRVAQTARLIAIKMGLTNEEADLIQSAGHVHDIGKVALDLAMVHKPGQLTELEWAEMKLHPVYGAEVLAKFESYRHGVPLVRGHHESWDGRGYPDRLRGRQIPLGARILAVADAFDAITSDRPYRRGSSIDRTLSILREGSDKQWDGAVVDALVTLALEPDSEIPVYRRDVALDRNHKPAPIEESKPPKVAAA